MSLNFKRVGEGKPIVMLHGLFGSLDNLGSISRELQSQFDVISVDLPDHGRSPHSPSFSYEQYAKQVLDVIELNELEQVSLLGHSMGGKVAMHMALNHPEKISSLIVADIAPVQYQARHNKVFDALKAVQLDKISSRKDAEKAMSQYIEEQGVIQFLLRSLTQTPDGKFAWRFNLDMLMRDYSQLSEGISHPIPYEAPTLFIKGGNSDYITAEHRPVITQLFPNASAKVMQGTGHWLHAEKPGVFAKLVKDFVTTI
ncbi:alpha/beta fold hydrolase [Paraneptunicella aestuarii]|uniref:alpha/beta fold hydrolase n=1 Tax=Paraneptunicella aestuarii TaxID=2831148 RepID=UPI001E5185D0|nr:alpha/beta fold hydrolase [Paraneptunicella aestuarii]UAA37271.1 alpha/beta fold hydrolase [Paraneptunicella aestuarii]